VQTKSRSFKDGKKGAALAVRVSPRDRKNYVKEILEDGTVKIGITASPVDGKANQALIRFLADILGTNPSKLEIIAGATSKNKLISIYDMETGSVQEKIRAALEA
jgi:uncharacterized protein (TIGR00251 family)